MSLRYRAVPLNTRVANGDVREQVRLRALQRVRERRAAAQTRLRSAASTTDTHENVRELLQLEYAEACRELADPRVAALSEDEYVELALMLERDCPVASEDEWTHLMAAAGVFEHEALALAAEAVDDEPGDLSRGVACPVCRDRVLQTALGTLFCACGLRIDTGAAVDLEHVRALLADSLLGHAQCCDAAPQFVVHDRFGLQALYLDCAHCAALVLIL